MKTYYLKYCQAQTDKFWGMQIFPECRTPLIRATRNNIGKGVMEFVGSGREVSEGVKKIYPVLIWINGENR